jgi:hypothetical protein
MKKTILSILLLIISLLSFAQSSYQDSLKAYIKNYIDQHEVVKGDDKKSMRFFDINKNYRVVASFEKVDNAQWFQMATSGKMKKLYRVYGVVTFRINDTLLHLNLYQSQSLMQMNDYKNLLFLPFTDVTSGIESYEGGRYIDLNIDDIQNNQVMIDFNKAYNPYCAYVTGVYNCPIPPHENHLPVAIRAGEKAYGKH